MEILLAFLDKIGNPKTFAANLQNSSGRPVESRGHLIEILKDIL